MKGFHALLLALLLPFLTVATTHAGSLDKYGGSDSYRQAPQQPAQPRESKREKRIRMAVERLQQAPPERQKKMVAAYNKRIKAAEKAKRYKAAGFYHEILQRAGFE